MLVFNGFTKTSLIDYPGLISSIVFVGGCNMRCPYCQNPDLINNQGILPDIKEQEVIKFLKSRKEFIDALVITGGEPTIHSEILPFIRKVKRMGLKVKLDTNGTNPELLTKLLDNKLLDYIAMDVKASPENYSKAIGGVKLSMSNIRKCIKLIIDSGVNYEFRTTVVPGINSKSDLLRIGKWLKGASKFALQQFRSEFPTLDPSYRHRSTYSLSELERFRKALMKYFKEVEVRGE